MGSSFYGSHSIGGGGGGGSSTTNANWTAEQGQEGYILNKPDIDIDENGSILLNGDVVLSEDPDQDMEAATKQYVDNNTLHVSSASDGDPEHLIFNFGIG